jgi:hypothetical protein
VEFHYSAKWSVSRDDVPQKVKQQIGPQTFILTVIWGIDGFHVVDLIAEQYSYNTQCFLSHILEPLLLVLFPDCHKLHSRRLSLHLDNCRVHRSKASESFSLKIRLFEYGIRLTVLTWHLLTFDFRPFGQMKAALPGQQFPGPKDLLTGIPEFLSQIQRSEWEIVFHHWKARVQ